MSDISAIWTDDTSAIPRKMRLHRWLNKKSARGACGLRLRIRVDMYGRPWYQWHRNGAMVTATINDFKRSLDKSIGFVRGYQAACADFGKPSMWVKR